MNSVIVSEFGAKTADPAAFEQLGVAVRGIEGRRREVDAVAGERIDDARGALLAIEGGAGRHYWAGVRTLLKDHATFEGREHQGAPDTVNSSRSSGSPSWTGPSSPC